MCNVRRYDKNGCCNPEVEMNGWDLTLKMMTRMTTMDLKTSDTFAKKRVRMELPFHIEAPKMERSPSSSSSQKKRSKRKYNAASKNDVLENWFIVDIRRLARERQLDARTTFHQEQPQFSRAEVQRHSRGSRWGK